MNEGYGFGGKEINLIVGELDFVKWRESRSPLIHVSRKFYLFVKGAIFALFSYWQIENYTAPGLELSQTQGFQLSIKLVFLPTPCYKQFLLGLEEPEKSADAENSGILRLFRICKS